MLFVLDVVRIGLRTRFQTSADIAFLVISRLLVRHVNVMKRLRQEIASVMEGGQVPTRDQIRKMPYLACVIKESGSEQFGTFLQSSRLYSLPGLRLYPPVPLNNREAVRTTLLPIGGGPEGDKPMLVRKGELVVFSQYVNSRKKTSSVPMHMTFVLSAGKAVNLRIFAGLIFLSVVDLGNVWARISLKWRFLTL